MLRTALRLPAACFATALALALPVALVRADDTEKPAEKPKKDTDDASIFADWKLCKQRGAKHCRERGEFWAKKASGKDLVWLGKILQRGEENAKAIQAYEKFLAYEPTKEEADLVKKNHPLARQALIEAYTAVRDWAKTIAACETFRTEHADSSAAIDTWDDQGRANRMLGDDEKALECFAKGAEKQFRAFSDIVDVHLCNGDVDKARAAVEKYGSNFDKQPDKLNWMKDLLATIGSPAPALDVAVGVGPQGSEPAKSYEKATIFFHWSVQSANIDRKLAKIEQLRRDKAEKVNALAIATYKKYNVETRKIEAELTQEQEAAGIRKLIDQSDQHLPPCALVPQAFLDAIKIKWDGQITVVDKEGRLRYARFNEEKAYDLAALEKVLAKLTEAPAAPK